LASSVVDPAASGAPPDHLDATTPGSGWSDRPCQRIAQQYRWDKVAMAQFNNDLLLWGSPKVIAAWIEIVRQSEAGLDSNIKATMLQRDLLRATRKDLSQFDRKLDNRDLMKLLVNDIDEHFDLGLVPKE
jgi:hypothetical protein